MSSLLFILYNVHVQCSVHKTCQLCNIINTISTIATDSVMLRKIANAEKRNGESYERNVDIHTVSQQYVPLISEVFLNQYLLIARFYLHHQHHSSLLVDIVVA